MTPPNPKIPNSRNRFLLFAAACVLLLTVQAIVFTPALQYPFIAYDDNTYVYENTNIQHLDWLSITNLFARPYFHSYTPLALLSHAIDFGIWELNPAGHHLTSFIIHLLNSLLVFMLCLEFLALMRNVSPSLRPSIQNLNLPSIGISFAITLLYAIHPLRVESVVWVSDRKDLLMTFFLLLSTISYLHFVTSHEKTSIRWFLISSVCFLLALLSKSTAIGFPFILIALDYVYLKKQNSSFDWRTVVLNKIPFAALSVAFAVVAINAAPESKLNTVIAQVSAEQRLLLPLYSLIFYPLKTIFPVGITPVYGAPDTWLLIAGNLAVVLVTAFAVVRTLRNRPGMMVGWLSYIVLILPTLSTSAGIQPWADRYAYAATIPLFVGVAMAFESFSDWRRRWRTASLVAPLTCCSLLFVLTMKQVALWQDAETLWRYATTISPRVPMTYANLGLALSDRKNPDEAIRMFRKAIELHADYAEAYYNLGVTYEQHGQLDSAEIYYMKAIQSDSLYSDAYVNLGNVYTNRGSFETGIALYTRASLMNPSDADIYYNLGYAYYQNGDKERAISYFRKTIALSPNYAKAFFNLAYVLLEMKNSDEALTNFTRAAQLGSAEARNFLKANGHSW